MQWEGCENWLISTRLLVLTNLNWQLKIIKKMKFIMEKLNNLLVIQLTTKLQVQSGFLCSKIYVLILKKKIKNFSWFQRFGYGNKKVGKRQIDFLNFLSLSIPTLPIIKNPPVHSTWNCWFFPHFSEKKFRFFSIIFFSY